MAAAAVKESLQTRRLSVDLTQVNLMHQLASAQKALVANVVQSRGALRDLVSSTSLFGLALGGHRGMGENLLNDHELLNLPNLWRENSLKSFVKAHQHGANFVEMDIQVTKDGVPVVWHDDDILFGPQSSPLSFRIDDLSFEEFKALGPQRLDHSDQIRELVPLHRKFRSRMQAERISDAHTAWHCFDDDCLPSLAQVLQSLPAELGLNLEIKMATPASLERTPEAELERMTQPIVDLLAGHLQQQGATRQILLSSFDPDICARVKQKLKCAALEEIPVMLLTTGGASDHADSRRTSIAAAIAFSAEHHLRGIVVDTTRLRAEQEAIQTARLHQLQVMTYGLENDDFDWIVQQWKLGVHAAIVDNVAAIVPRFVQYVQMQALNRQ